MEELFNTKISETPYKVLFANEEYIFQPESGQGSENFSFRREHDEWHGSENISPGLRQEAIDVLEKYLLKQH